MGPNVNFFYVLVHVADPKYIGIKTCWFGLVWFRLRRINVYSKGIRFSKETIGKQTSILFSENCFLEFEQTTKYSSNRQKSRKKTVTRKILTCARFEELVFYELQIYPQKIRKLKSKYMMRQPTDCMC